MRRRSLSAFAFVLVMVLMLADSRVLFAMEENIVNGNTEYEEGTSEQETDEIAECIEEEVVTSENCEEETQDDTENEDKAEWKEEVEDSSEEETAEEVICFPGLPENFSLSEMQEERKILAAHIEDTGAFEEDVACVAGEILVSAETEEEARIYAQAYGGTLKRYVDSVAVILLPEEGDVTVQAAVFASLDEAKRLPVAWPNAYYYIENEAEENIVTDEATEFEAELSSVYDDKYLNPIYSEYQWFHHVIGSERAWRNGYTGAGIKVAVLDSGVMLNHEDLQVRGTSVLEDGDAKDILGHGTHVCGLIGATLQNGVGGAGVAPESTVYSIKVTDENRVTADNLIAGMQAAKHYEADIVNISSASPYYNALIEDRIKVLYHSGIAVFVAAGNQGTNAYTYPAACEGAIAVASFDEATQPSFFTNYGKMIDYAAPGDSILSTVNDKELLYGKKSGTSSASPIAAGSAAVVLQYARQKGLIKKEATSYDVDLLVSLLEKGAVKVKATGMGKGYISLTKALGLSETIDTPSLTVCPGAYEAESLTLGFQVIPGTQVYYSVNGKKPVVEGGTVLYADLYTEPFIVSEGVITIKAIAIDIETRQVSKVLTATYNLKPKITEISLSAQGSTVIKPGSSVTIKADITPAYAANRKLVWSVSPGNEGVTVKKGVVKASSSATEGEYIVRAASSDGTDVKAYFTIYVKKAQKNPIVSIKRSVSGTVSVNKSRSLKMGITVTKQDKSQGAPEELQWYSLNSKVADVICSEGQIRILGIKEGTTKIIGAAKDGSGKKITIPVSVIIRAESLTADSVREVSRGKTITIQTEVLPANTTNPKLVWSVSPAGKGVTVQNGKVKATRKALLGEYIIEAKTKDGSSLTAQTTVTVTADKITTFSFKESKKHIFRVKNNYGAKTYAYLYLNISGSGFENWTVTSSDPEILKVVRTGNNEVYLEATGNGCKKVTVTAKTTDGTNKKTTCKVKVVNPASNMWITVPKGRSENIAKGKSMQLKVTMEDAYGPLSKESYKYEWTSTRPENITVNQKGVVKAIKGSGTTSVYAKTTDGSGMFATAYLYATVAPKEISLDGVGRLKVGEQKAYEIGISSSGNGDVYYDSVRVEINKEGLGYSPISVGKFHLIGNKKGTYVVRIYTVDGTNRVKKYKIIVE